MKKNIQILVIICVIITIGSYINPGGKGSKTKVEEYSYEPIQQQDSEEKNYVSDFKKLTLNDLRFLANEEKNANPENTQKTIGLLQMLHMGCEFDAHDSDINDYDLAQLVNIMKKANDIFNGEQMFNILSSTGFTAINLTGCKNISNKGLIYLTECCKNLKEIQITCGPKITNNGLIMLSLVCKNIKTISIEGSTIKTRMENKYLFFPSKTMHPRITKGVRVTKNISDAGIIAFFKNCPYLTHLSLKNCFVSEEGVKEIERLGKNFKTLFID